MNVLSIPSQIESGKNLLKNWAKVNRIAEHHHPTDEDIENTFTDIANQLARDIIATQILYMTTAVTSLLSMVSTCVAIVGFIAAFVPGIGVIPAGSLATVIGATAGTMFLDQIGSEKYDAVIEGEGKLHSRVIGTIKDSVTNQPLQ